MTKMSFTFWLLSVALFRDKSICYVFAAKLNLKCSMKFELYLSFTQLSNFYFDPRHHVLLFQKDASKLLSYYFLIEKFHLSYCLVAKNPNYRCQNHEHHLVDQAYFELHSDFLTLLTLTFKSKYHSHQLCSLKLLNSNHLLLMKAL